MSTTEARTCAVIGGGALIGRSLVHRLLKLGGWVVKIANSPELEHDGSSIINEAISSGRASFVTVDLHSKSQISQAIEGSRVVFYLQPSTSSNDFYTNYTLIVQGVKNVINACRECKVKQLIYNSSADVVSNWSYDIDNGDELLPYATKFDMLADLHTQAEALVLYANDIDGLLTCALRPCNVFGPGDVKIIPFIVKGAKFGWTKFILGSGQNKSDLTYVENAAHALICAEEALRSHMVSVAGKAFFITNSEPANFWEFVSCILVGLGYQRPTIKLPAMLARKIIVLVKWIHGKLNSSKLNCFTAVDNFVELALCTRTFNCSAAHKQIGYKPVVSLEEGVALTIESFSSLTWDNSCLRRGKIDGLSSVEHLLGVGKAADILLWRDEKKTFACFLSLVAVCFWFFTSVGTFISSAAKLLLLVAVVLMSYSLFPSNMFGFTFQRIPHYCFDISKGDMVAVMSNVACIWNGGVSVARKMSRGDDWNLFLKMVFSLYILEFLSSHCLAAVIGVGIVLAFTSFFVYDQYEEEINEITRFLFGTNK